MQKHFATISQTISLKLDLYIICDVKQKHCPFTHTQMKRSQHIQSWKINHHNGLHTDRNEAKKETLELSFYPNADNVALYLHVSLQYIK